MDAKKVLDVVGRCWTVGRLDAEICIPEAIFLFFFLYMQNIYLR